MGSGALHLPLRSTCSEIEGPGAVGRVACLPDGARAVGLVALTLAAFLVLAIGAVMAEPQFPPLTGRVVDTAHLLSGADRAELTADIAALETRSSDQLVVVTLGSLQGYEIEEFGYKLGRFWQIGQKDKDNGVLLIVAPNERKVRIEVGRGLEPILTDALSKSII